MKDQNEGVDEIAEAINRMTRAQIERDELAKMYSELSNSISFNMLQHRLKDEGLGRGIIDYCMKQIANLYPELKSEKAKETREKYIAGRETSKGVSDTARTPLHTGDGGVQSARQ